MSPETPATEESAVEAIGNADLEAGRALASKRHHPIVRWCGDAGELGDQGPLYLIGAGILATGLVRKNPRCALTGISIVAAVGVADLTKSAVKRLVKRTRPMHSLDGKGHEIGVGGSPDKKKQSFPSGHVACTVAAAHVVSGSYPSATPYVGTAAAAIGLSRVANGSHWPLDVVAGLLIGLASGGVVRKLIAQAFPNLR